MKWELALFAVNNSRVLWEFYKTIPTGRYLYYYWSEHGPIVGDDHRKKPSWSRNIDPGLSYSDFLTILGNDFRVEDQLKRLEEQFKPAEKRSIFERIFKL